MSLVSTMAMTTTSPVTVVSSGLSSVSSVTVAPSLMGIPVLLDQGGVAQLPPLMPRGSGGVIGPASVAQQQPPSSMPLLAYDNYAMGAPQVGFFLRVDPPTIFVYFIFGVCSGVCFSLLGAEVDAVFTYEGQPLGSAPCNPLEFTHGRHMCNLVMVIGLHLVCIEWLLPLLLWVGGAFCYSFGCSQPSHLYGGAYSLGGSLESHPIPQPSLHDGEGSPFPGLVPSDDMVNFESVIDIKPGNSSVVIGYQVDEFIHTRSAEQFVACSHIYPGFTGKVSSLTHFPLEPGCEDYAFLDQAVVDFEQG